MPNPGFYHQVWEDGREGKSQTHRRLLPRVAPAEARAVNQRRRPDRRRDDGAGLAAVRTRQVWRPDLVDGIIGALIKEEFGRGDRHPLLDAVHEVLRGGDAGCWPKGPLCRRSFKT